METINKQALRDLREAGMERDQAEAVASHIPDWTQFATKDDIRAIQLSIREIQVATRNDIRELQVTTQNDIRELQVTTQNDIRELRVTTQNDIRELRAELKLELGHMEKRLIRWIVLLLVVPVLLTLASGVINQFF